MEQVTSNPKENQPLKTKHLEKIRPELNLEKWSAIWQPAKSKNLPARRVLQRERSLRDGSRVTARVEVDFTSRGTLTTEDQLTYYALIKLWEEKGRLEGHIPFSTRHLAKVLKKRWGTNVINATTESLERLRATPLTWRNAYYNATTRETVEELTIFNLLSDLRIVRRKIDGHITKEAGYYRFNDFILKNLIANYTKPLLLDVVLGFKSEIAQLLYTHLDLVLADKSVYERRSRELFDDLGLRGYKKPSNRKLKLARALQELQDVRISTGILTAVRLEPTVDEQDFKLVVRKSATASQTLGPDQEERGEATTPAQPRRVETLPETRARILVTLFYKLFHGVENAHPQTKELDQAVSLIARHGIDKATYIVDASRDLAGETKFKPAHFGAILGSLEARALARYEREERTRALVAERDVALKEQQRRQDESRRLTKERLEALPNEDRQALHDRVKADLFERFPSTIDHLQGQALESTIHAAMLQELERQAQEERLLAPRNSAKPAVENRGDPPQGSSTPTAGPENLSA